MQCKFRYLNLRQALPVAAVLLYCVDGVVCNVCDYFFHDIYKDYYWLSLMGFVFPPGTVRGVVYSFIIGVPIVFGIWDMRAYRPDFSASFGRRLVVAATGFLGVIAWSRIHHFIKDESLSLIIYSGVDKALVGPEYLEAESLPLPEGYSRFLAGLDVIVLGTFEESVYVFLLVVLIYRLRVRVPFAVVSVILLRGVFHLHYGTIFTLLIYAPTGVFTALYFLRTNRFLPLMLGHAVNNLFARLYASGTPTYGTYTYYLLCIVFPVLTYVGLVLTLGVFSRLGQGIQMPENVETSIPTVAVDELVDHGTD